MKSFYSIIRYASNQWSNENITVGLLAVSEKDIFFETSDHKIRLAKNLNPQANKLLEFSIDQFSSFIEVEQRKFQNNFRADEWQPALLLEKPVLIHTLINKLYRYNSGILQFSALEFINKEFNQEVFEQYFNKIIGVPDSSSEEEKVPSEFFRSIEKKLYEPLKDKIDVDYQLKKKSLPALYFDYHLDSIGVNGKVVCATKPFGDQ